ncbi:4360_t:CDS:2, partial [Dentiscutata heterogama]
FNTSHLYSLVEFYHGSLKIQGLFIMSYNNYNNSWDNQNMPVQDYDSPAASTSVTHNRVNNWVGMNGGSPSYSQGYTNGVSTGYGGTLSEQPSTNHISAQRGAPNGISVNTSNLLLRNSTIIGTDAGKIICVADVRGNISQLNTLAKETGAVAVIHSGDFGFYENSSLDRISD